MPHYHAVVWMDHAEARVFAFNAEDVETKVFHPHGHKVHVHHKADTIGSGKMAADRDYMSRVAQSLNEHGEVLVVGPGTAKLEFIRHLHREAPEIEKKIIAVETVDHPTDGQVVAYARKYFKAADRMRP